ncbi:MAG: response regulator transcription factor [Oscillospiraceae bacterium]
MGKILIIEDDTDINNLIAEALGKESYSCTQAFSGTEALLHMEADSFDLAVMDLMLPGMSGEELIVKLHNEYSLPVIVLSAKDSLDSKISLLRSGAEDYMTKPFAVEELIARVDVQLRRSSQAAGKSAGKAVIRKQLKLCPESFSAEINGKALLLTKQEFKILELLMSNPNRVFSKQDIYDYAWDDIYIGEDKTINMHISNIRKKIKALTDEEYIETVWGVGFRAAK